jgi:hypothetical protein
MPDEETDEEEDTLELELDPLSRLDDPARCENAGNAKAKSVTTENSTLVMFFMTLPPPTAYAIRASGCEPINPNTSVTKATSLIGDSILLDDIWGAVVQVML